VAASGIVDFLKRQIVLAVPGNWQKADQLSLVRRAAARPKIRLGTNPKASFLRKFGSYIGISGCLKGSVWGPFLTFLKAKTTQ